MLAACDRLTILLDAAARPAAETIATGRNMSFPFVVGVYSYLVELWLPEPRLQLNNTVPCQNTLYSKGVVIVIRAVVVGVLPFAFADPESVLVFEADVAQNKPGYRRQNYIFSPLLPRHGSDSHCSLSSFP